MATRQKYVKESICVELKSDWTAEDVQRHLEVCQCTKPVPKGTKAFFGTSYLDTPFFAFNKNFVAIRPQKRVITGLANLYEDADRWVQVPHGILRTGVRVKTAFTPDHPAWDEIQTGIAENDTMMFQAGDYAICDTFYVCGLPSVVMVRPVHHVVGGLKESDQSYRIPLNCIVYGIRQTGIPSTIGLEKIPKGIRLNQPSQLKKFGLFDNFLEALHTNRADLIDLGVNGALLDRAEFRQSHSTNRDIIDILETGFQNAGTSNLFDKSFPTPGQLWNNDPNLRFKDPVRLARSGLTDGKLVIYCLVYRCGDGDQTVWDWYWGRSGDSPSCLQRHADIIQSEDEIPSSLIHYERAREILKKQNSDWAWVPVVIIDKSGDTDRQNLPRMLEEIMICLSGSYNDGLLTLSPLMKGSFWTVALANQLTRIVSEVYDANPHVARPTKGQGLNVASPLLETSVEEPGLWVQATVLNPDGTPHVYNFVGRARGVYSHADTSNQKSCFIGSRRRPDGTASNFRISFPIDEMEDIDAVIPVMEITGDPNTEHPLPYVHVPRVGPYSNWDQVNRFALRLDYCTKGGQLHKRYLQSNKCGESPQEKHLTYAMAWMEALLGFSWSQNQLFQHLTPTPYSVRVKTVTENILFQALVVNEKVPDRVCAFAATNTPRQILGGVRARKTDSLLDSDTLVSSRYGHDHRYVFDGAIEADEEEEKALATSNEVEDEA